MTRTVMTLVMIVGAYTAGYNEITHVEVMEYVEIAKKRMEVAFRIAAEGYIRDYSPPDNTEKNGALTHKEISSMKKKELVELVLKLQEKK